MRMDNNALARAWRECIRQLRWTRAKTRDRALLWKGDHRPGSERKHGLSPAEVKEMAGG